MSFLVDCDLTKAETLQPAEVRYLQYWIFILYVNRTITFVSYESYQNVLILTED